MTKYIASIYPIERTVTRVYQHPKTRAQAKFTLKAVAKGEAPFILEVADHYQIETLPWFRGVVNGRQAQERRTISASEPNGIAEDVLRELTKDHPDMTPDAHPGIWIVRDTMPMLKEDGTLEVDADGHPISRPATESEKKAMFEEDHQAAIAAQANFADKCFEQASIMAENPKAVPFIPPYSKLLAKYYGREFKWLYRQSDTDVKKCSFCTATISADAAKCPQCNEIVDKRRYDELKLAQKQVAQVA